MEQLAERRMQREEEAAADVEDDSDEESDEERDGSEGEDDGEDDGGASDEDEDDEDEDDEDVCGHLFPPIVDIFKLTSATHADHDGRAKDGRRQTHVFHFCCQDVRATGAPSLP